MRFLVSIALTCCLITQALAQEFEQEPIRYSQSQPDNRVSRLIEQVNKGETRLAFAQRGPRDRQGRSLREFDLQTRLFKYPCSYLVYSPSFAALPHEVKGYVLRRMREVLSGQDESERFQHLSVVDRAAICEILEETLPGWSASRWPADQDDHPE